jgi:hypothetical protein
MVFMSWLGPQVAAAPFAVRWGAYVAALTAHHLGVIALLGLLLGFAQRIGKVKKNCKEPSVPFMEMVGANVEVRGDQGPVWPRRRRSVFLRVTLLPGYWGSPPQP